MLMWHSFKIKCLQLMKKHKNEPQIILSDMQFHSLVCPMFDCKALINVYKNIVPVAGWQARRNACH